MNNEEFKKAAKGAKTLKNFCEQFGNDIYGEILLEELFKGLMENEIVCLFGEQKEKGPQVDNGPQSEQNN